MTCHPDHTNGLRSRYSVDVLVVVTTVCLAACHPAADTASEIQTVFHTAAMADTPVTGAVPTAGSRAGAGKQTEAAAAPAAGDVYDGWKMYAVHCERCHGQDALGSALAPDLRKSAGQLGHDGFVQVVVNGRSGKGMPAFKGVLEPPQIENVFAYVQARASGALGPGRPQR
jgi:mono/diheme cytochrome c family protein